MEEILVLVIQVLIELLFNIVISAPFELASITAPSSKGDNPVIQAMIWLILGLAIGGVSIAVFSHSLISIGALRVFNLVAAPPTAAYLSQAIARRWTKSNPSINPRNHFWHAFCLTLGVAIVRFAYASRL